jgi:hypothetical protein
LSGALYRWTRNGSNTANPGDTLNALTVKTGGVYNIRITNGNGCSTLMRDTGVTANPKPVTSAITGSATAFVNSSQPYSVVNTAGSSYYWFISSGAQTSGTNTNAITVQWGSTPGTGSVKVLETSSAGCKGDTVSRTVTLNAIPDSLRLDKDTVKFTSAAGSQPVSLTSNRAWSITNPASWLTVLPGSGSGNSTLNLTVQANALATSRTVTVTATAGSVTRTLIVTQSGTGLFHMENSCNEPVTAKVFDCFGRKIAHFNAASGERTELNLTELPAGTYFIQMEAKGLTGWRKLILSK